jgi:hypothetical protein
MKLFGKLVFLAVVAFSCTTKSTDTKAAAKVTTETFTLKTSKKFLFDASKGETAGNADWILDWDKSPQRYPTPNQSKVTASTPETYWNGALSAWGIALVKLGHTVESLPSKNTITYGENNIQDLKNYDVFIVDEPNIKFTDAEKTAILNFIKNGGGLFMIADHTGSDRNHDGYDSVQIWNDLMENNSVQKNPFGLKFNLNTFSEISSNILTSTDNSILNGSQGKVAQLKYSAGASITIISHVKKVQGLVWSNNSDKSYDNIMCASSTFGKGRIVVIGDSSPADDGTGNPKDKLYYGWTELPSHAALHLNASLWLAKL